MNTPLQKAAQAMIDRWDSPYWKHAPTADYIDELRKALDAEITQSVEPYAVFQGLVDSGEHGAFNLDLLKMIPRGAYLYLHPPQPHAEPEQSGERAELANEIRSTANHLSRYDTPGFPMNPFAAVCHKAADMLEADAREAKRVPMAGEEIEKIADGCRAGAGSVWPHAFARALEAHHKVLPAQKPADWSAA